MKMPGPQKLRTRKKQRRDAAAIDSAARFIEGWLSYWFARSNLPGLSIAIRHGDKLVLNRSWGYANLKTKEKLTPRHIFRIASQSKMFTATAIGILKDRGFLDFDDPVQKHLSWLAKSGGLGDITLRQLLSHTGGLPRDPNGAYYWDMEKTFVPADDFKRQVLKMKTLKAQAAFKYSNVGFGLLGLVIEEISGRRYLDFITHEIIKPLRLHNTAAEFDRAPPEKLVMGYAPPVNGTRKPYNPRVLINCWEAANSVCSTPADMTDFMRRKNNDGLLQRSTRKELTKEFARIYDDTTYGLGHERLLTGGRIFAGHGGSFPGQSTYTLYNENLGISISLFANAQGHVIDGILDGTLKTIALHLESDSLVHLGNYQNQNEAHAAILLGNRLKLFDLSEDSLFEYSRTFPQTAPNRYKITGTGGYDFEGEDVVFTQKGGKPVMLYSTLTYKKM